MQPSEAPGLVTTSRNAGTDEIERARGIARACGLPFVERERASTERMVVVERAAARMWIGETSLSSHPGMGLVRVRRLMRGRETDPLVDVAGVQPGDRVFDATFGFGQDALVLAHAVGPEGHVVATEKSPMLAALALAGMPHWSRPANDLMRRVDLRCTDARAFLASAASRSFDVVFIDPMFRDPRSAAPDFAALRLLADATPLDLEFLQQARRVARRCVVVKDAWPGRELVRLGVDPIHVRRRADIIFGVLEAEI